MRWVLEPNQELEKSRNLSSRKAASRKNSSHRSDIWWDKGAGAFHSAGQSKEG